MTLRHNLAMPVGSAPTHTFARAFASKVDSRRKRAANSPMVAVCKNCSIATARMLSCALRSSVGSPRAASADGFSISSSRRWNHVLLAPTHQSCSSAPAIALKPWVWSSGRYESHNLCAAPIATLLPVLHGGYTVDPVGNMLHSRAKPGKLRPRVSGEARYRRVKARGAPAA